MDSAVDLFPALRTPGDRPALRFGEHSLDYTRLARACAQHAAHLQALGIVPGERVAVWTQPALGTLVALVAHAAHGFVSVPLNPELGASELAHVLNDAEPVAVLSTRPEDAARTPGRRALTLPSSPAPAKGALPDATTPPPLEATALILYTSGTTGAPKGALLSGANIAATTDGLIDAWALSERDTLVHALPVFHAHGLIFGLFGALRAGASLHWTAPFRPESLARALCDGPSRVLYAVPTMYRRLCDAAEQDAGVREGLAAARLLVSGSAALPEREHARIERLAGQRPVERYGLTETLINTAIRHDGDRRAGYVGLPLKGVQLQLVDDARQPLGIGDPARMGEVAVRGPNVFAGYLNRPDATAEVLDADGWFYTGDLATRDADGYLRLVGRMATDLIKTGGFKVGAGEVEAALLEHPGVSEAAVIGAPDPDLGERIVAFVVARAGAEAPSAEALIDHCAQRVSRHKRPREVHLVDSLPRNALGKVQKKRLTLP